MDKRSKIYQSLNKGLLEDLKVSSENVDKIVDLHFEKYELFNIMRKLATQEAFEELRYVAEEITDLEFSIQKSWGFEPNKLWHKFWELPGCICPVMANTERWPDGDYRKDPKCPIHGTVSKRSV